MNFKKNVGLILCEMASAPMASAWYERFEPPVDNEDFYVDEPLDSDYFLSPKYRRTKNLPKTPRNICPRLDSCDQDNYPEKEFCDEDHYDEDLIDERESLLVQCEEWQKVKILAASTIQRYWLECRYNPGYKMCQKVLFRNLDIISTQKN